MSPKSRGRKKKPTRTSKPARVRDLRVVFDDVEVPQRPLGFLEQKALATQAKRAATAERDAAERRAFAMPLREAVIDWVSDRAWHARRSGRLTDQNPAEVAFQVRVDILDVKPSIWRRLVLPASMTLSELHLALQLAFDWTDSHLHCFTSGDRFIDNPRQLDDVEDESAVTLADVLSGPGDRLDYEYDLGDSWRHRLVVEDVVPDTARTVRCIGGRQSAPPEDCGGVYGYGALLMALNDPDHPDFAMAREVIGDAADFDVATVDSRLRGVPVS